MNWMHGRSLFARATSRPPIEISLRASERRTKRTRVEAERLAEQTHEVAVRAIADAVGDGDDLHTRSNLVHGKLETHATDVASNGLAGLKWESCAEVTSTTARIARDGDEPQGLANVAPDVSLGAFNDRRKGRAHADRSVDRRGRMRAEV